MKEMDPLCTIFSRPADSRIGNLLSAFCGADDAEPCRLRCMRIGLASGPWLVTLLVSKFSCNALMCHCIIPMVRKSHFKALVGALLRQLRLLPMAKSTQVCLDVTTTHMFQLVMYVHGCPQNKLLCSKLPYIPPHA